MLLPQHPFRQRWLLSIHLGPRPLRICPVVWDLFIHVLGMKLENF